MPGTLMNWKVMRTLGKGASCKVKLGQDMETGQKVAIKIMNQELDKKTIQLVKTEVAAMS